MRLKFIVRDADGTFLAEGNQAPGGALWTVIERAIKTAIPSWHDGVLVGISRNDEGCGYAAPGYFTVKTRDGETFAVTLAEDVAR